MAEVAPRRELECELEIASRVLTPSAWIGPVLALPGLVVLACQIVSGATARVLATLALFGLAVALNHGAARYITRSRLTLSRGRLTMIRPSRTRVVNPERAITRVLRVDYRYVRGGQGGTVFLLIDDLGHTALRLDALVWGADDLESLSVALGAPLEVLPGRMTAKRLRRDYPGAFPWALAHLYATTFMVILVVAIVIAVVQQG